jgi:hypothetical protein
MKIKKSSIEHVSDEKGGTYIASRLRNPQEEIAKDNGSDTPYGVVAVLATLIMLAVAVVLYMNLEFFKATGLFVQ